MEVSIEPIQIVSDQIEGLAAAAVALLPNMLAAMAVLIITALFAFVVGKLLAKLLARSSTRPSLVAAVEKAARLGIWFAGLLVAATILFPNLTPTKLLAGLGIGSIAIGLAFKDIFENFLAGFLILLRKPMRIGDDVECQDLAGRVEHISIRDTFLRMRSGELILVPNSYLFKNPVKILTDKPQRRISVVVGVAYGEDVDEAREVISSAVAGLETRDRSKSFEVLASEFNSSSIDFLVRWWAASTPLAEHKSRDEAVAAIKAALDTAGIEIPFPYRTLTFPKPVQISTNDLSDQRE